MAREPSYPTATGSQDLARPAGEASHSAALGGHPGAETLGTKEPFTRSPLSGSQETDFIEVFGTKIHTGAAPQPRTWPGIIQDQ